ncbi:M10 family metallopeptidase C-terminal domain-containing protein [Novosphingobium sp.]|uniref:M10 family metallopeptidase C-terminal domain-containing protein n=1 Tax=Novosphingobium sp. TaxID=1874826 RepID=UPI0025F98BB8|nr:M10 family metallopeptidase C-terminal domain-containing protein [Novosphingobium sp.]
MSRTVKPAVSDSTLETELAAYPKADAFELIGKYTAAANVTAVAASADDPLSFNLDIYAGGGNTYRSKPIYTLDKVVDQIDSGRTLPTQNGVITYSFTDLSHLTGVYNNKNFGFTAPDGFSPFSSAQRAEARQSIQLWDDLVAPSFVEKKGIGADIQFANSFDPAQAYAYYPGNGQKYQSDVFIADPTINYTNNWLSLGGYGATTLVHELGHTIGLSHPGNYNYDPNLALNYVNYAEYAQDSTQYSIMSYWRAGETGASWVNWGQFLNNYEQTPMIHDILTAQTKYGADLTTRTGDTVYGFNSTAGRDVFDFTQNKWPAISIFDAGGNDTIDLSGFTASVFLDLHDGKFSSAGAAVPTLSEVNANRAALSSELGVNFGPVLASTLASVSASRLTLAANKIAAETGVTGVFATEFDNISIAYGTIIENGIGGSARDVLYGNAVNNVLKGLGGDDVIDGFEGADSLWGGAGNDTFSFRFIEQGDVIEDFQSGADKIDLRATQIDFTWIGDSAFSGHAGELRFSGDLLQGDTNGDGLADLSIAVMGSDPLVTDILFI